MSRSADPNSPNYDPRMDPGSPSYDQTYDPHSPYYIDRRETSETGDQVEGQAEHQVDQEIENGGFFDRLIGIFTRNGRVDDAYAERMSDRANQLAEGVRTRPAPAMQSVNYLAYDHPKLKDMATTGVNPGEVGTSGDMWINAGNAMVKFQTEVARAINSSEADWQGGAGDAGRRFMAGIGNWVGTAGQSAQLAGTQTGLHAQAVETARNTMPEPVTWDRNAAIADIASASNPFEAAVRAGKQVAQYQAHQEAHQRAAEVVGRCDANLGGASTMPAFSTPPTMGGGAKKPGASTPTEAKALPPTVLSGRWARVGTGPACRVGPAPPAPGSRTLRSREALAGLGSRVGPAVRAVAGSREDPGARVDRVGREVRAGPESLVGLGVQAGREALVGRGVRAVPVIPVYRVAALAGVCRASAGRAAPADPARGSTDSREGTGFRGRPARSVRATARKARATCRGPRTCRCCRGPVSVPVEVRSRVWVSRWAAGFRVVAWFPGSGRVARWGRRAGCPGLVRSPEVRGRGAGPGSAGCGASPDLAGVAPVWGRAAAPPGWVACRSAAAGVRARRTACTSGRTTSSSRTWSRCSAPTS